MWKKTPSSKSQNPSQTMENERTDIPSNLKQLQPNTSKNLQHHASPSQRDTDTPTAQEPVHAGARMTLANNICPGDSQNRIEYPKTEVINAGTRNHAKSMHIQASIQSRQNNTTQRRQPRSMSTVHAGRHCSTMQRKKPAIHAEPQDNLLTTPNVNNGG